MTRCLLHTVARILARAEFNSGTQYADEINSPLSVVHRYLNMSEETWAKLACKRAAKELNLDTSFTQHLHWSWTLQSILGNADYIEALSASARYRYDLYGTDKRDSTYVIAVPLELLNGSTLCFDS